ncbi:hypothetical protein [Pelomonas sp. SE-A7]|uniref:hypothetical protein n=1 Tax=Pelomonas sp. SE-A7 TaxID=3054953 RepID=UPI00259CB6BB|nr:hypothetical protein [Pelomonas sp. SE-A7]MDM4767327.1 hypothetical protein [Pelomonas sp. SE-A7]
MTSVWAQRVQAEAPTTVALIAAVGDQISFVRQRPSTGSHTDPFKRQTVQTQGQQLNYAVLRGLDRALELEEPKTQRVLLSWNPPAEFAEVLDKANTRDRNELLLDELRKYLMAAPERKQWDRIEAIVPHYSWRGTKGMAGKLSGIGIYVQPLAATSFDIDSEGTVNEVSERNGDYKTVNPKTGEAGKYSTYVAPYFFFDRVTLDAQTLKVLSRKPQLDSVKYHDPDAASLDVGQQMSMADMMGKLLDIAEKSAYRSVRGSVEVSAPKAIDTPAKAK